MKNDLPYFTHDNDARNNAKMKALRAQCGWEGYGQFWALNEMIAAAPSARLDLSRKVVRAATACELGMTTEALDKFLAFLRDPEECGLIDYQDGIVTTQRTSEDYARVEADRMRKRGEKPQGAEKPQNGAEECENGAEAARRKHTEQSRAEQSREDKSNAEQCVPAAVVSVQEVKAALASNLLAARLTTGDHLVIAERLNSKGLDAGFITYCLTRTAEAKAKNPGAFLRTALMGGSKGFDNYPEQYRASRVVSVSTRSARIPPPERCDNCGEVLRVTTCDAMCPSCRATWTYHTTESAWLKDLPAQAMG